MPVLLLAMTCRQVGTKQLLQLVVPVIPETSAGLIKA